MPAGAARLRPLNAELPQVVIEGTGEFDLLRQQAGDEVRGTLQSMAKLGMFPEAAIATILAISGRLPLSLLPPAPTTVMISPPDTFT